MLFSFIFYILHYFQGFWCLPITIVLSFLHKNSVGVVRFSEWQCKGTFFKEVLFCSQVEKDIVGIWFEDSDVGKESFYLFLNHFCWKKSKNDSQTEFLSLLNCIKSKSLNKIILRRHMSINFDKKSFYDLNSSSVTAFGGNRHYDYADKGCNSDCNKNFKFAVPPVH